MGAFAVLVYESKATRMDWDWDKHCGDKHLLDVLAKHLGWFIPFSTVQAFIVDRVSCDVFDITKCSYTVK